MDDCCKEAKAENARLAQSLKGLQWPTKRGDSKVSLAKAESDAKQALSTSNALDYWQGEIRKAKEEGLRQASDILFALHKYDKAANILILELDKSNQSKGESGEGR